MIIRRQPGANIIDVIDRVKALLPELARSISPAIDVEVALDRAQTIRASVHDVERTLAHQRSCSSSLVVFAVPAQRARDRDPERRGAAVAGRRRSA